jgi:hypothetical protein
VPLFLREWCLGGRYRQPNWPDFRRGIFDEL